MVNENLKNEKRVNELARLIVSEARLTGQALRKHPNTEGDEVNGC